MSQTQDPVPALSLSCPVCSARFRGSPVCSRCGSDLRELMRIAAAAWQARQRCRAALRAGDLEVAMRELHEARQLQSLYDWNPAGGFAR
jgi:predicted amidophosphoribosyltransferase